MIIPLNQKAMVRCSDGHCYPCVVLSQMTDYHHLLPAVFVRLIGNPSHTNVTRMIVNMDRVYFGGYDDKASGSI